MSTLIVEIVGIKKVEPIETADNLEMITVKGWQVVSQKGLYKVGDMAVYAPIDSVLPINLSDVMEITKYLSKGRVKTVKLRGVYSQGLLIPLKFLPEHIEKQAIVGDDVRKILGIEKYEPPLPIRMSGDARPEHPSFFKYTNIENYKNFPDIFQENECVSISEKIHGTNCRVANINGEIFVGSHNVNLKENNKNLFWGVAKLYDLKNILKPGMQLFGEVYGHGVQKLNYDLKKIDIRFFDLMINQKYINMNEFLNFCQEYHLPTVPQLYNGKWNKNLLQFAEGTSTIAKHIKEGIVIKPEIERYDPKIDRVVLKHLNEKYLLRDYGDLH